MVKRFTPIRIGVGSGRARQVTSASELQAILRPQLQAIEREFKRWAKHMEEETAPIVVDALKPTFEKSQKYCPKDTGDLVSSGYLESRKFRGNVVAEIGYARGNKPSYAIYVHEMLEYRHKAPTRAKFLEAAIDEDLSDIQGRILKNLKIASGT